MGPELPQVVEYCSDCRGFKAEASLYEPLQGIRVTGVVSSICMTGCYVQAAVPIFKHALIQLHIWKGHESFDLWGNVESSGETGGMGIKFFRTLDARQAKVLRDWMSELTAPSNGQCSPSK